jgi:DNA-binding protein YbaB
MTHSETGDDIAGFDAEIAQLKARAESAQEQIESATATVASPDGSVTVTVGASGALTDVRFGQRAYERPPQQLAALLMRMCGKAQQQVSAKVMTAFGGLVGENSAAMDMLTQFLPADPDAEEEAEQNGPADEWHQPPPPPTRPPMPPRGQQPPQPPPSQQPFRRNESRGPRPSTGRPQHDEADDDFTNPW